MGKTRGKTPTIFATVGLAAVAALTLANWRDIAAQGYLLRFQKEPRLLLDYVAEPEDSVPAYAVRKFLATTAGGGALFRLFLEPQEEILRRGMGRPHDPLVSGVLAIIGDSVSARFDYRSGAALAVESPLKPPLEGSAAKWVAAVLDRLVGREFRPDAYPDCRFEFIPGIEALDLFYSTCSKLTVEIDPATPHLKTARETSIRSTAALRIRTDPRGGGKGPDRRAVSPGQPRRTGESPSRSPPSRIRMDAGKN